MQHKPMLYTKFDTGVFSQPSHTQKKEKRKNAREKQQARKENTTLHMFVCRLCNYIAWFSCTHDCASSSLSLVQRSQQKSASASWMP